MVMDKRIKLPEQEDESPLNQLMRRYLLHAWVMLHSRSLSTKTAYAWLRSYSWNTAQCKVKPVPCETFTFSRVDYRIHSIQRKVLLSAVIATSTLSLRLSSYLQVGEKIQVGITDWHSGVYGVYDRSATEDGVFRVPEYRDPDIETL